MFDALKSLRGESFITWRMFHDGWFGDYYKVFEDAALDLCDLGHEAWMEID